MDKLINRDQFHAYFLQVWHWVQQNVLVMGTLLELTAIAVAASVAWLLARPLRAAFISVRERHANYRVLKSLWHVAAGLAMPLVWLVLQWGAIGIASANGWRYHLLTVTASLLTAWVVIRIATSFVKDRLWSSAIALTAWVIAALNIIGMLDQTVAMLDSAGANFGDVRISALAILKGIFALGALLWVASILSNVFENRIKTAPNLTPSVQVLFTKLFKMTLIFLVILAAVSSVGIDITAFAVFGGAIGVGIGFGLQRIVSNLISGLILLLDKSIKPGDVIAVGDDYGRVDSLGARYVSVTTRDGIEHLIPNEDLIVNRVENWSHSQNLYRNRLQVGVHYQCDVPKAMALCLEACGEPERVLKDPEPVCLVRGFGDSSVDLELRYWINDPMNGCTNLNSAIMLSIWEKFHANDIEIPYPQRDIHLRTPHVRDLDDIVQAVRGKPGGNAGG